MKKVQLLFLALILMIAGCDPADQYPISFKYGTNTWYAASAPTLLTGGKIYINATSITQGQNPISFVLNQYAMVDTFDIDSINNAFLFGAATSTGYYAKANNPASLIIKEFNPGNQHIVAEFYGWLSTANRTDSVLVTDGKFDLNYQQ